MTELRMFDVEPVVDQAEGEKLSAGRRLTIRNNTLIARGVHPATNRPLLGGAPRRTCAECAHCTPVRACRTFWKCEKHRLGKSSSAASDIRKGWPACELFTPPTPQEI